MDHVDLKSYPFPEGVNIPRLMPFQEFPWNGDGYLAAEVLRLKEAHGLRMAFETGTCLGSTTIWLCHNFGCVVSTEVNADYNRIAIKRMSTQAQEENYELRLGDAAKLIEVLHDEVGHNTMCWLDGHWGPNCPLLNELAIIAKANVKPCILIHDFQVPGMDFGFDKMPDGRPFSFELIRPYLNDIYGEGKWKHNYPTKVEGAKRGWISVEPIRD